MDGLVRKNASLDRALRELQDKILDLRQGHPPVVDLDEAIFPICNFPPCITLWSLYKSTQKYPGVVLEQMLGKDQTLKRLTSQVQYSETTLKNGTYPNSARALTDKARKALEKSLQSNTPKN